MSDSESTIGDIEMEVLGGATSPPRSADDQMKTGNCCLHASSRVIFSMVFERYGICLSRESILNQFKCEAQNRGSPLFKSYQKGANVENVVAALNKRLGNHNDHNIIDECNGRSYSIKFERKRISFSRLCELMQIGTGSCLAVCGIKTSKEHHASHAVAAHGLVAGTKDRLRAKNSWGGSDEELEFSESDVVANHIDMIIPQIVSIHGTLTGSKEAVPKDRDCYEHIIKCVNGNRSLGAFTVRCGNASTEILSLNLHKAGVSYADGRTYVGEFKGLRFHGSGKCVYSDGSSYEGQWANGVKHGRGKRISHDGSKTYVGDHKNGRRHGYGIYTIETSDGKQRDWVDDEEHGCGTLEDSDCKYEGKWVNGLMHGQGIFTHLRVGWRFEGGFEYGERSGQGKITWLNDDDDFSLEGSWRRTGNVNYVVELANSQHWKLTWRSGCCSMNGSTGIATISWADGCVETIHQIPDRVDDLKALVESKISSWSADRDKQRREDDFWRRLFLST